MIVFPEAAPVLHSMYSSINVRQENPGKGQNLALRPTLHITVQAWSQYYSGDKLMHTMHLKSHMSTTNFSNDSCYTSVRTLQMNSQLQINIFRHSNLEVMQ